MMSQVAWAGHRRSRRCKCLVKRVAGRSAIRTKNRRGVRTGQMARVGTSPQGAAALWQQTGGRRIRGESLHTSARTRNARRSHQQVGSWAGIGFESRQQIRAICALCQCGRLRAMAGPTRWCSAPPKP